MTPGMSILIKMLHLKINSDGIYRCCNGLHLFSKKDCLFLQKLNLWLTVDIL